MWPFARRKTPADALPPEERAVLFCARKWNFFQDQHKFPDDLPLADQVALFTTRMRETLPGEVPRLATLSDADLQAFVLRGILTSGVTSRQDLQQALGHALPQT
jgi:hypothetical protein